MEYAGTDFLKAPRAGRGKFNQGVSIYFGIKSQVSGNSLTAHNSDKEIGYLARNIFSRRSVDWKIFKIDRFQKQSRGGPCFQTVKFDPNLVEGNILDAFEVMALDYEDNTIFGLYPNILTMGPTSPQVIAIHQRYSLTSFSSPQYDGLIPCFFGETFLVRTKQFQFGAPIRIESQYSCNLVVRVFWQPPNTL